jgi:hypothetical protein
MVFSFDIDGVLAKMHTPIYIRAVNEHFDFGLSDEELATLTYRAFWTHPTIVAYRARVGEEAARQALGWIYYRPDVLVQAKRLKGALAGVQHCATLATEIYYVTCRYSPRPTVNRGMQNATQTWLASQGFPRADHAIFCMD